MSKHYLSVTFLIMLAAVSLQAAHEGTLTVTPAVVALKGTTGQSTKQRVVMFNNTSRDFAFDLIAEDVVVRDGKRTFVPAGETAGSIAATAVFSRRSVIVHPGATAPVDVTLTLPLNTTNRGVVVIFKGTTLLTNGRIPMTASMGTLMTFSVSDQMNLEAAALEIAPQTPTKNLSIRQVCSNNGTEPLMARGTAAILDARGALAGRIALEPRRLFPAEQTIIAGEFAGELPPGRYRVLLTFDLGAQNLTRSAQVDIQ